MPEVARPNLVKLLAERDAALKATGGHRPAGDDVSARREAIEATIVAYLKTQRKPVEVGPLNLCLTRDRMHFIEIDRRTGHPVYLPPSAKECGWRGLLFDYRKGAGRRNSPEIVP